MTSLFCRALRYLLDPSFSVGEWNDGHAVFYAMNWFFLVLIPVGYLANLVCHYFPIQPPTDLERAAAREYYISLMRLRR
jgi:hypothetical protein